MARYYSCDLKHDCLNCTHPDCIEGMPRVKKPSAKEEAKQIINKKYNRSEEALEKMRERGRRYKDLNRDKVYATNKIYKENHPELCRSISRKYERIKLLKKGKGTIAGTVMIHGKETIVYKGRKNYWYLFGNEYGEIEEADICWMWVEKVGAKNE